MKPDAQRAQVYLALIGGADGIIWWIWPPCRADNWATIKLLAAEMRKLSPVLTEPPAPTKVRWEPAALRDTVQVRAIQRNDITFLLAANAVETAATVQIKLPASAKPRAPGWFENRVMQITGGAFSDRFEGYDRHVYEIHGQWPTSEEITLQIKLDQPGREDPVHRAAPLEDELLLDPGCESDLYWSFDSTDAVPQVAYKRLDEGTRMSGRRSLFSERTGAGKSATYPGRWVTLKPHTRYSFGGWARLESVGEAQAGLYLESPSGEVRRATEMTISNYAPWRQYGTVFATDEQTVLARPVVRFHSGIGRLWADDFFLVEASDRCRNMIVDGGFEGPTAQPGSPRWWFDRYGLTSAGQIGGPDALWGLDRSEHYQGKQCLRMTNPLTDIGPADAHPVAEQRLAPGLVLHQGRSYVFSFYLKGDRPDLALSAFAGSWYSYHQFKATDGWQRYSFPYTPENDETQPFVRVDLLGQGKVWLDEVQFEEGTEPTECRDWEE
ncbi:MAG: hypothetical protein GW892_21660 [Armatimonadetes bacterium]|nr:hypothetical protein [Armatimonadota bacterium]